MAVHRRSWQTRRMDDEALLARAEQALTEIKVNQGLSEDHAAVLAALRSRLKGTARVPARGGRGDGGTEPR
jgi:hypothetical protein